MADLSSAISSADPSPDLRGLGAIVGIGHTDYAADYAARKDPNAQQKTPEDLAAIAFDRALADSGLERRDIDGLGVSFLYGGADPPTLASRLGLAPRHFQPGGGMIAGVVPSAVLSLAKGECDTIALVYAVASRAIGRQYGGATYSGSGRDSYYYYHPWRWSSQAAHWALMFTYYQHTYGATEADLGEVAVTVRRHATQNEHAIMRTPLTVEEYLASRYIVRPLHLFDLCLVNDGAVCLIVRRTDLSRDLAHVPVVVAGWSDVFVHESKMHHMVKERLRTHLAEAGRIAFDMAGLSLGDVDHFEGYDASTIHLINQLEGIGFVEPGEGLAFCKDGGMTLGGALPTNTAGGILSESYMHGWNHVVEVVRQLRHEAGPRQVTDAAVSLQCVATTESAHPVLYMRGDA